MSTEVLKEKRIKWSLEEDLYLKDIVNDAQKKARLSSSEGCINERVKKIWTSCAALMKERFGYPYSSKQIRERYVERLDPNVISKKKNEGDLKILLEISSLMIPLNQPPKIYKRILDARGLSYGPNAIKNWVNTKTGRQSIEDFSKQASSMTSEQKEERVKELIFSLTFGEDLKYSQELSSSESELNVGEFSPQKRQKTFSDSKESLLGTEDSEILAFLEGINWNDDINT